MHGTCKNEDLEKFWGSDVLAAFVRKAVTKSKLVYIYIYRQAPGTAKTSSYLCLKCYSQVRLRNS